jgi:hypothetical protein
MATQTPLARRSRRASRRLVIALGTITGFAVVVVAAWLLADLAARSSEVIRRGYAGVRTLSIDADAGDIELRAAPRGARLTVAEHVTRGLAAPRRAASLVAGRLRLRSECRDWFGGQCGVRYVVSVPRGTTVVARSGSGDVEADGLTSTTPIRLETGSGEISANGLSAPDLQLHSGSGGVGGTALRARAIAATTGSGSIALAVRKAPARLLADTGSGDLVLSLPDEEYALDASSGSGRVDDDGVRQNFRSPRRVTARSGSGDVLVHVTRP